MNVAETGLTWTGTRLLAHLLSPPGNPVYLSTVLEPPGYKCYVDLGHDQGYEFVFWKAVNPAHPHFPYGYAVDPD